MARHVMDTETRQEFDNMVNHVDKLTGEISTMCSEIKQELESLRADMLTKEDLKLVL